MKNFFIPAVVAAFTLASTVSSAQIIPGIPYPTEQDQRKRDKTDRKRDRDDRDRDVRRDREVRDRDGRVINNERNLPPGQAKKVYGSKSAKIYAPGQRKKSGNGTYSNSQVPQRISVDERDVRRASNGQLYYRDANGNIYWRGDDGYYYLDTRNSTRNRNNDVRDNDDDDDDRYEERKKQHKNKKHGNSKGKSKKK